MQLALCLLLSTNLGTSVWAALGKTKAGRAGRLLFFARCSRPFRFEHGGLRDAGVHLRAVLGGGYEDKTKLLLPLPFFAALLLVPALTLYGLVKSPSGWSVEENRALADVPEVSLQSMLDGTLAQNLETFYSDHIFARRQLLKLSTRCFR